MQTDKDIFFKKVTGWLFDDCGIVPIKRKIKKIFLEVISNTKILYIKLFQSNWQRSRFF